MVKIRMEITMPDELLQALLQHMRDFDIQHDPERKGVFRMGMGIEAPHISAQTLQSIFNSIRPPFEEQGIFPPAAEA